MIRKQDILLCIHDTSYRAWLSAHMEQITDADWIAVVQKSNMPLHMKIKMLREMQKDAASFPHADMRVRLQSVICAMEEALQLASIVSADTIFLLTEKWHDRDDGVLAYREHTEPYPTFQQALDSIRLQYDDGAAPNDYDNAWNEITCYQLSEKAYAKRCTYVVSQSGIIWNIVLPESYHYDCDMGRLYLPTPFQPGDILTVDCRPFHEPFRAVVVYRHQPDDCCSPGCLGYVDGKLTRRSVKHYFSGYNAFSPLLRICKCTDALPESEKLITDVSTFIRSNLGGAHYLDSRWADCSEEAVYHLMHDYQASKQD